MFVPLSLPAALAALTLVLSGIGGPAPDREPAAGVADTRVAQARSVADAPQRVTVVSLTDRLGQRTDVALSGLGELSVPRPTEAIRTLPLPVDDFLVAGVTWSRGQALPSGARIEVRVREGRAWSYWHELEAEDAGLSATEHLAGTGPFLVGGGTAVQIRVTGNSAALPDDLRLSLIPSNPIPEETVISEVPEDASALSSPIPNAEPGTIAGSTEPPVSAPSGTPGTAPRATDGPPPTTESDATGPVDVTEPETTETTEPETTEPPQNGSGAAPASGVEAGVFEAFPGRLIEAVGALPVDVAPTLAGTATVPAPTVISRGGWGADESLMTWQPTFRPLAGTVIHHTAGTNNYTASQSASIVRGIYHYHAVTRGWGDIGYNFLVDKYGQVFEGRSGSLNAAKDVMPVGAHAAGFNTGTLGISAMGDYTLVNAPQVILDRMADVLAWRFAAAGIDVKTQSGFTSPGTSFRPAGQPLGRVFAHRDVGATTCPGDDIYSRIGSLTTAVAERTAQAAGGRSPFGNFENASAVTGGIDLKGWAIDPDTKDSIYIWVTVDGAGQHLYANVSRPDVSSAYPNGGSAHGFRSVISATAGKHRVCVTASNVGLGSHTSLGCRDVEVTAQNTLDTAKESTPGSPDPIGELRHAVAVPGGIEIMGWTLDPDTTSSIYAWVTVNADGQHIYADDAWPELADRYPGHGHVHGFTRLIRTEPGPYRICVTASNVGPGQHHGLGCGDVSVRGGSPYGNLEAVRATPGGIEVAGWAIDPDTTSPIYLWATVDGVGRHIHASRTRNDVAGAYPGYGPLHGFSEVMPTTPGSHRVCVTVSNVSTGNHTSLGCASVTVR